MAADPTPEDLRVAIEGNAGDDVVLDIIARGEKASPGFINDIMNEEGLAPLQISVQMGRTRLTKLLVDNGADVNARGPLKRTPLRTALSVYQYEDARVLLRCPRLFSEPLPERVGTLSIACSDLISRPEYFDIVDSLLAKGYDINENDGAPLCYALNGSRSEGGFGLVQKLLSVGADPNVLFTDKTMPMYIGILGGPSGLRPLNVAFGTPHQLNALDLGDILLKAGALPFRKNLAGETAVQYITNHCSFADKEVVDRFKTQIAMLDIRSTGLFPLRQHSPLSKLNGDLAGLLSTFLTDVTPHLKLRISILQNDWPRVIEVLGSMEKVGGFLSLAIENEMPLEIFETLMHKTMDVNERDNAGNTPLHTAAMDDMNMRYMEVLLRHDNIDVNARNNAGHSVLWSSLNHRQNIGAFRLLVASGKLQRTDEDVMSFVDTLNDVYLNFFVDELVRLGYSANGNQGTPLFVAVLLGKVEVARVLLRNGADPNMMTEGSNMSLLNLAVITDYKSVEQAVEITQLLVDRDAKLTGGGGQDALEYARLVRADDRIVNVLKARAAFLERNGAVLEGKKKTRK